MRKVTLASSVITTVAGTGAGGYSGDNGPAISATLNYPHGIAAENSVSLYVSDHANHRIRKIDLETGIITTFAGTGTAGYSGDFGLAIEAEIMSPTGVNLDSDNNVYFGDTGYFVIRKVTVSTGVISTVAGIGSLSGGYNGDNIQATSAAFFRPYDVVIDSSFNLYIADESNNRVRKVVFATGIVETIVGTGEASSTGDGFAATSATVNDPCFLRFDSAGNLYIADYTGNRIRKVTNVVTSNPTLTPTSAPTSTPTSTSNTTSTPTSTSNTISTPTSSPTSTPTYDIHSTSIVQLYFSIRGWPSEQVDTSQEIIFKSLTVQSAAVRAPFISLSYEFAALIRNNRRLFRSLVNSLWQLTVTASVITTNPQSTKTAFTSYMAISFDVTALIEQLNTACNCSSYGSIVVDYGVYELPPPHKYAKVSDYVPVQYTELIVALPVILFCVSCVITWILIMNSNYTKVAAASLLCVSLLAACILFADLYYLLFAKYYSYQLLLASAIFVLLPNLQFIIVLHDIHAFPYPLIEYYPGKIASDKCNINMFWFWLSYSQGAPLINRQQQSFTFEHHDSIPKVLIFIVSWLLLLALQLLSLLPYALFLAMMMLSYYAVLLSVGSFLFQTKLLIYTPVWNTFLYLFTGKPNVFDKRGVDFDTSLLNESLFVQLLVLSIPHVIIKGVNNRLVDIDSGITPGYSVSLLVSVIAVAIGIYRYLIMNIMVSFGADLQVAGMQTFGLPGGTYDVRHNHELQDLQKASLLHIAPQYELELASSKYLQIINKCFMAQSFDILEPKIVLFNSLRQLNMRPLSSIAVAITCRVFDLVIQDSTDLSTYHYLRSLGIAKAIDLLGCSADAVRGIVSRVSNKKARKLVRIYLLSIVAHSANDGGVMDMVAAALYCATGATIVDTLEHSKVVRQVVDLESSKFSHVELIELPSALSVSRVEKSIPSNDDHNAVLQSEPISTKNFTTIPDGEAPSASHPRSRVNEKSGSFLLNLFHPKSYDELVQSDVIGSNQPLDEGVKAAETVPSDESEESDADWVIKPAPRRKWF